MFSQEKTITESLADHVDFTWYLNTYPDVASAGVDPRWHFVHHGRFENRHPRALVATHWDHELWSGDPAPALTSLHNLLSVDSVERYYAAWALGRWHASFARWQDALSALRIFYSSPLGPAFIPHLGPVLLMCMALWETEDIQAARTLLREQLAERGPQPDLLLERISQTEGLDKLAPLNRLFSAAGLVPVTCKRGSDTVTVSIDHLGAGQASWFRAMVFRRFLPIRQQPLVSVIVPAYNAQDTIYTALQSLLQQSWHNLEIIVVDDASSDATVERVDALTAADRRIRLIRHDGNKGAYAARNTGLTAARGDFITVHDSDDWSHPEKIERQVRPLLAEERKVASVSHGARCSSCLRFFSERMDTSLIHLNLSSLMFRRLVFARLGYWDRVRVGADTEYYHRILRVFGRDAVQEVMPGVPLSFERHEPKSLTQVGATHWSTLFRGVRRDYIEAALQWHNESRDGKNLFLDAEPARRPFPAPAEICR